MPTPTPSDPCGNALGNGNEIISGPSGPSGADGDSVFRSLTVDPTDPNTILMGTERNGFVKSTDGGVTWTRHRQGMRHSSGIGYPEVWNIAISPSDPSTVFAATLDSPGLVTGNSPSAPAGIYKSTDGGETWRRANCGLTSSRITSVQFDPTNPDVAVAGVEGGTPTHTGFETGYVDGGMYRTTDGGENWSRVFLGQNDNKNGFWHLLAIGEAPTTFFTFGMNFDDLTEDLGFLRSVDGGASWESLGSQQLTPFRITNFAISSDGSVIYANQRDSFFMWTSRNGGDSWTQSPLNQASGPVAVSPADPNLVIYGSSASLYRSTNGLQSSARVLTSTIPSGRSQEPSFHDIVFAPSDPSIVYAATEGYLLYKSTNVGVSFTLMKNIRADVLNVIP